MKNRPDLLLIVTLIALAGLALAACVPDRSGESSSDDFAATPLDEFPDGLGAGFPVADRVEKGDTGVGDTAPNFAFFLADGRGSDLASLQGKPVVINFWATWCGPCRAEMPELVALHNDNPAVVVLEVNVREKSEAVEEFAAEFGMNMPVILDPEGAIGRAYGVRNMPTTVFVGPDGTIGARWPGLLTGEQLTGFIEQIMPQ